MPYRDPLTITIEGSNDSNANSEKALDFTLLYEGPSGLKDDPGRNSWGEVINFKNKVGFKTFRILVTATRATRWP